MYRPNWQKLHSLRSLHQYGKQNVMQEIHVLLKLCVKKCSESVEVGLIYRRMEHKHMLYYSYTGDLGRL